ncbi:MAG: choline dehydrogenase [Rhodospirillales bacterium]
MSKEPTADFIIVGAGSAGSVLANRLSAEVGTSVLLLEAGPPDTALSLRIPAAMAANLRSSAHNWAFTGEPEPALNGRRIRHDRGKTLGGSSSINGMVCIRGHALDYAAWRQAGCPGWSYADVLPYFKRLENYTGGESLYRGVGGPLQVKRPDTETLHPVTTAFLRAGEEAGYPVTDDIGGEKQEGFGLLDRTTHNGERWSAARAYLNPAKGRANLNIETGALVRRVVFENNKAVGVEYTDRSGARRTARARREVILAAGAVGSPQILMLSGVGPGGHLRDMGISVIADRPGVGANLNEHPDFVLKFKLKKPVSLMPQMRGWRSILAGLRWLAFKDGVCATNHFEAVACFRSAPGVEYPDLQLTVMPVGLMVDGWAPIPEHAFQIHIGLMRPHSRGTVRLRDARPESPPRILVNYLGDARDLTAMRRGARLVRELTAQPAFAELAGGEIFPGAAAESDDALDDAIRDATDTQWHLSCTCRMGAPDDPAAVTDAEGRVIGVQGLRVIDASVMPQVVNANTNCPVIMIAEKLSDAVLGKPPLAPIDAPVWRNPDWETAQR